MRNCREHGFKGTRDDIIDDMTLFNQADVMVNAYLQGGLLGISFLVVMKESNMYRSPPL